MSVMVYINESSFWKGGEWEKNQKVIVSSLTALLLV